MIRSAMKRRTNKKPSSPLDVKDDVDRLFACFKCGISPPQSAMPKKRSRRKRRAEAEGQGSGEEMPPPGVMWVPDSLEKDEIGTSMAIKFGSRKHISPLVFYGSPHGAPMKRPLHVLRLLREIQVELSEQKDFSKSKEVWATFPRQEEALKFAKSHTKVYVFSYQDHLTGQRRFLASTYDEFWERYKMMTPKLRHHYEVIQEGLPCHMYFDLEFDKRVNHDRNVDEMVDILLSVIFDALDDKYSIKGNSEWVVELDSSTKEKFSRHLIIRIPSTAFKDNSHVGAFISEICTRIADLRGSDPRVEKLYIRKDSDSPCQLFLDTAVYSRNRCFRLVFSSKAGKNSFLEPTSRFKCRSLVQDEKHVFMESMICQTDVDCSKLLICKLDLDFKKTLSFDSELNLYSGQNQTSKELDFYHNESNHTSTFSTGKSPFQSLDAFVESIASDGNVPGKIRSWYWFSMDGLIVYSMLRNRYCERIGREHKSNHVMYVVDFKREGYYQKCYDPDCKGYRSPLRQVPSDLIPDDLRLFNSARAADNEQLINVDNDVDVSEEGEKTSSSNVRAITDSCKKEIRWWQEAISYAEVVESVGKQQNCTNLKLEEDWTDDQDWWMDVDKFTNQVENGTS